MQAADARNFISAGYMLGISASGVSKKITRFEQRLVGTLVHPITRIETPTAEGGAISLTAADEVEFESAKPKWSQTTPLPEGRLCIRLPIHAPEITFAKTLRWSAQRLSQAGVRTPLLE
jgi:DNA-binding transcriptional LysR family regulator